MKRLADFVANVARGRATGLLSGQARRSCARQRKSAPPGCLRWVTSDKTHIEHNETAHMDFCCNGPKPEVGIQMGIEPPPSRRKGWISHLYVYRQQIDETLCLNPNGG